jgi:hypothetical protein
LLCVTAPVFVKLKLAGDAAPATEAVTEYVPTAEFAVNVLDVALPLASVVAVCVVAPPANVPLAPDPGAAKVTVTPLAALPFTVTIATSGAANAAPVCAFWPLPLLAAIATLAAVFVNVKLADAVTPEIVAVTAYAPTVEFAVNVFDAVWPFASVVSVSVFDPANVPLAPDAGAVKITGTPLAAFPFPVTVTTSGAEKAEPTWALCGDPPTAVIVTTGSDDVVFVAQPVIQPKATQTTPATILA